MSPIVAARCRRSTLSRAFYLQGGDDVNIDEILQIWENVDGVREDKFGWIPQKVFLCVSYSDAVDAEMRSCVYHIVDDIPLARQRGRGAAWPPRHASRLASKLCVARSRSRCERQYFPLCFLDEPPAPYW